MKRLNMLIAASLFTVAGATGAQAFDPTHYAAVKAGQKSCQWCDLSGANLKKVNFTGADLTGTNFTGADLTNVNLTNADLTGADLTGVVVTGAVLTGAKFLGADLDQVDLTGAVLTGARLENANCDWATKFPADSGLSCVGVTIERN